MATTFYSLNEVQKHDGKDGNNVWIIIKDNVYDPTQFLEEHPGGGDLIMEWAGKDATKAFDEFGHSSDAKKELKKYKIGELCEEDRKKKQQKQAGNPIKETKDKDNRRSFCSYLTCGICG